MLTDEARTHVEKYVRKRLPNRAAPRKADRAAAQIEWRKLGKVFENATRDELSAWYSDASVAGRRAIVQVMANVRPADKDHAEIAAMICAVQRRAQCDATQEHIASIRAQHAAELQCVRAERDELRKELAEERDSCEKTARDLLAITEQCEEQRSNAARHMRAQKAEVVKKLWAQDETVKVKAEAYDLTKSLQEKSGEAFSQRTTVNSLAMLLRKFRADVTTAADRGEHELVVNALRDHHERAEREGL